jgi:NADH-quinone oxidoreductase subunit C
MEEGKKPDTGQAEAVDRGEQPEPSKEGSTETPKPTPKPSGADEKAVGEGEKPASSAPSEEASKPAAGGRGAESEKAGVKPAGKPVVKPGAKPPPRKPRPKGPTYEDLGDDPLLTELKKHFGDDKVSGQSFLKQRIYTVGLDVLYDVMLFLRDQAPSPFDYLNDLTALDYLGDEQRFCMVYQICAHTSNEIIRVKARLGADEVVPSMTAIWKTSNWMEREVYDMYGIEFSGHPDLKRILLPDDWLGFPLRKDYDIKLQDQTWIRNHLKIRKVPS